MFSRNEKRPPGTDTLIGQATTLEGTVDCETDLRIEGRIRGSIRCSRNITIGETGVVYADVEGVSVVIAGSLTGDVIASGSLLIESTGQLNGNATCSAFIIKDGGQFNGTSSMGDAKKASASASVTPNSTAAVSASENGA
ncbi:bactofilin family protein [Paenibacillus dendritiformis]|uniref:bactofilin family protein n=1 Tax=Paenibacillus dendritiformis TaxID=130049 RepID=UPI000DA8AB1C|nr:polymer-forming cytoskeletal protein [Paenibacillus dendritiformis]PZM62339.1 polymer-forming cytoskeletal protein [Paenibacillus dendritiformis]